MLVISERSPFHRFSWNTASWSEARSGNCSRFAKRRISGYLPGQHSVAGGLTGKYRRDKAVPKDSRAGVGDRWDDNEEQRGGEHT